jgi:hypothetical protein
MPNYFSLTRKTDREAGPVPFVTIDEEICAAFEVAPHPYLYFVGWYDDIGFSLAMGKSWDEIRAGHAKWRTDAEGKGDREFAEHLTTLSKVATWLEERFEVDCGYTRSKA